MSVGTPRQFVTFLLIPTLPLSPRSVRIINRAKLYSGPTIQLWPSNCKMMHHLLKGHQTTQKYRKYLLFFCPMGWTQKSKSWFFIPYLFQTWLHRCNDCFLAFKCHPVRCASKERLGKFFISYKWPSKWFQKRTRNSYLQSTHSETQ